MEKREKISLKWVNDFLHCVVHTRDVYIFSASVFSNFTVRSPTGGDVQHEAAGASDRVRVALDGEFAPARGSRPRLRRGFRVYRHHGRRVGGRRDGSAGRTQTRTEEGSNHSSRVG